VHALVQPSDDARNSYAGTGCWRLAGLLVRPDAEAGGVQLVDRRHRHHASGTG